MKINIGITDDHQLFLKSLGILIGTFPGCEVVTESLHGEELLRKLALLTTQPDILLVDVNMPVMDGPRTVEKVLKVYPAIKIAALSMKDDDVSVIRMLKAGCCAYLLKDIHPTELEKALEEIYKKGYYNADVSNINYRRLILKAGDTDTPKLTDREKEFLRMACSELTYKQIAAEMFLSERTIDGYRESIFSKLNVKSRVGMALEALRRNLASL